MSSALLDAVVTRCRSDTGTGGLRNATSPLVTGVFLERAPIGQTRPYIVVTEQASTQDDSKGTRSALVEMALSVYVDANNGIGQVRGITDRLRAVLHRQVPTGITGYTFTALQRVGGRAVPDEDEAVYRHVEQYRGHEHATTT